MQPVTLKCGAVVQVGNALQVIPRGRGVPYVVYVLYHPQSDGWVDQQLAVNTAAGIRFSDARPMYLDDVVPADAACTVVGSIQEALVWLATMPALEEG